jgi:hypothetical protein
MTEMRAWELRCAERIASVERGEVPFDEAAREGEDEQHEILRRHGSSRANARRRFWFTDPPDFDPEREPVESVSLLPDGIAEVRTRQEFQFEYPRAWWLTKEGGEWRLLKRFRIRPCGEFSEYDL